MDPTQFDPEDDRAATDPSAAETHEGAPAYSAAPDDDAAPQDDDAQGAPEEQIDWQAAGAQWQQKAIAAEQRAQALEAQQQQLAFQASQYAWQREEEEHHQRTGNLDYEQKVAADRDFYKKREDRLMGWAQTATQAVWINQHADQVMRAYGLADEDRVRLGSDPAQMEAVAYSIATERQRYQTDLDATRKELKQLKRQLQANRALDNPAYRQGGARPGTNVPGFDPNDLGQWKRALGIPDGR